VIYEYECASGHIIERHLPIEDRNLPQQCDCGLTAARIMSATRGFVQRECRYDSPIDGRPISTWRERKEDLARNGCQEYDPEMKKDAQRFREREQANLEAALDATVEKSILTMSGKQREKLGAELQSGVDITPARGTVNKSTITEIQR
jgi:hypothetical protein